MPRAIWSGAISFGLVNIPVKLYSAVSRKTVRFHQIDAESGARVRQKRVGGDGEEVAYEQIVKGYEIGPDRYVTITPEELESLEPQKTRTIDIEDFVDLEDIDPMFYDHPYYLAPDTGAAKAYRLLVDAMEDSGKVAIARWPSSSASWRRCVATARPSRAARRRREPYSPSRAWWPAWSCVSGPRAGPCARPPSRGCATTSIRKIAPAKEGKSALAR